MSRVILNRIYTGLFVELDETMKNKKSELRSFNVKFRLSIGLITIRMSYKCQSQRVLSSSDIGYANVIIYYKEKSENRVSSTLPSSFFSYMYCQRVIGTNSFRLLPVSSGSANWYISDSKQRMAPEVVASLDSISSHKPAEKINTACFTNGPKDLFSKTSVTCALCR